MNVNVINRGMLCSSSVVSKLRKAPTPYRQLSNIISYTGHFVNLVNFRLVLRYAVFHTLHVLSARNGKFESEVQWEVSC